MSKKKTKTSRFDKVWEYASWDNILKLAVLCIFANNYSLVTILAKQNDPEMIVGAVSVGLATLGLGLYTFINKK